MTVVGRWALSRVARLGGLVTSSVSGLLGALVLAAIQRPTHYEGVPCVAHEFKGSASFMFAGCCWCRSLAVEGRSGVSRGTPLECVSQVLSNTALWNDRPFSGRACPSA